MFKTNLVIIAAGLTLTACGSPAKNPGVATLESPSAQSGATQRAKQPNEVRLRFDTTEEERRRLALRWAACLKQNGVPFNVKGPEKPGARSDEIPSSDQPKAAFKKCEPLFPQPPWELDSDNPGFAKNFHKVIVCMKKRGAGVVELPNGEGWNYAKDNTMSGAAIEKIQKECERSEFGGA